MRFQITFFISILIFTIFLTGCPAPPTPPNANVNGTNNAAAPNNSTSDLTTTKKAEAPTENNAPTIGPVVAAYYDAIKKKDETALRKVLSADFIKSLEADAKSEKKSLIAFLVEIEKVPEKPVEVRNEKIEGEKAVAQIKGGTYLNWTPFEFVKENGEWKYTGKSPDFKDVSNSASNSNTAK